MAQCIEVYFIEGAMIERVAGTKMTNYEIIAPFRTLLVSPCR